MLNVSIKLTNILSILIPVSLILYKAWSKAFIRVKWLAKGDTMTMSLLYYMCIVALAIRHVFGSCLTYYSDKTQKSPRRKLLDKRRVCCSQSL